jgi:hypothetical protein
MISGEFRKWNNVWEDDTIRIERSHRTYDKQSDDETDPYIIDITLEDDSESESDTEESTYFNYYSEAGELYAWMDDESTLTANGAVEITLKRVVKKDIVGYNKRGEIQSVKPKPRTIKII